MNITDHQTNFLHFQFGEQHCFSLKDLQIHHNYNYLFREQLGLVKLLNEKFLNLLLILLQKLKLELYSKIIIDSHFGQMLQLADFYYFIKLNPGQYLLKIPVIHFVKPIDLSFKLQVD